jgi:hypothetical protein
MCSRTNNNSNDAYREHFLDYFSRQELSDDWFEDVERFEKVVIEKRK